MDVSRLAIKAYYIPHSSDASRMITQFDKELSTEYIDAIAKHYNSTFNEKYPEIIETTPERVYMEHDARDFVEKIVGTPAIGSVYWRDSSVGGIRGQYIGEYKTILIRDKQFEHPEVQHMSDMSVLVHELAHSTGDSCGGPVFINIEPGGGLGCNFPYGQTVGQNIIRLSKENGEHTIDGEGNFFEEAFAEQTAAQYRAGMMDDPDALQYFKIDGATYTLPARYVSGNHIARLRGEKDEYELGSPAFAAYSIDLMSEMCGQNLYDLQCQMRNPEYEAAAKKQFITAANTVRANLYQELRELQYSEKDFIHGFKLVQAACTS